MMLWEEDEKRQSLWRRHEKVTRWEERIMCKYHIYVPGISRISSTSKPYQITHFDVNTLSNGFFRAPQELSGHHANNVVICFCPVYLLDLGDPGIYYTCVCVELYIILCVFCNPCICMHISMSFRTNLNQFPLMDPFRDTERLGTTFLCSWALSLLENQTFKGRWSLYNILQVVLWPNHQRVWWLESHQVPRPGVHWSGIWSCHIKRVAGAAWVFR